MTLNRLVVTKAINDHLLGFEFRNDELYRIKDLASTIPIGSIYCGQVHSVAKNINAAFVYIQDDVKGFLPLSETMGNVKIGDKVLVQINVDKMKTKEFGLTSKFQLKSPSLILTVGNVEIGISKKISDKHRREELKELMTRYKNREFGFIVRTRAKSMDNAAIMADAASLIERYTKLVMKFKHIAPKTLLYNTNSNAAYCQEFLSYEDSKIITDDREFFNEISKYNILCEFNKLTNVSLLNQYSLQKNINNAINTNVWLDCGGYLVIEHTEAMTVIDVNTGKYNVGRDREKAIFKVNKEACYEIAKQLRIRNISGMVIVDFINMENKEHILELKTYIKELLDHDYVKASFAGFSNLGLGEITRKKEESPLKEILEK